MLASMLVTALATPNLSATEILNWVVFSGGQGNRLPYVLFMLRSTLNCAQRCEKQLPSSWRQKCLQKLPPSPGRVVKSPWFKTFGLCLS